MTQLCEKVLLQFLVTADVVTKFDHMEKMDGGQITCLCRIFFFHSRVFSQAKPLGAVFSQQAQLSDRSKRFILWKFLTNVSGSCDSISSCKLGDVTYVDIRRNLALYEWSSHSWSKNEIQQRIVRKSSRISRKRVLQTARFPRVPTKLG